VTDSVWIVVVARVGSAAKSRLAATLSAEQRGRLALGMLADVIEVCGQARGRVAGTLAVVDEPAARAVAVRGGAHAVADPGTGNMNAAVTAGLRAARTHGASTVLIVPGDVPLITLADIEALLDVAGSAPRAVVVGSSHDGQGTSSDLASARQVWGGTSEPASPLAHRPWSALVLAWRWMSIRPKTWSGSRPPARARTRPPHWRSYVRIPTKPSSGRRTPGSPASRYVDRTVFSPFPTSAGNCLGECAKFNATSTS
jgi:2-phospho-L-lactate guanylyltransferase (CobY/MobA/RfbA family)